METWQFNLSLIPSIAVILSSTNRIALGLTDEINVRLMQNEAMFREVLPSKIRQLKRLSISILIMYVSLSLLVMNALLVGMSLLEVKYEKILVFLSITLFFVAIYYKILFSWNAYFIRQKQFKHFLK